MLVDGLVFCRRWQPSSMLPYRRRTSCDKLHPWTNRRPAKIVIAGHTRYVEDDRTVLGGSAVTGGPPEFDKPHLPRAGCVPRSQRKVDLPVFAFQK